MFLLSFYMDSFGLNYSENQMKPINIHFNKITHFKINSHLSIDN